MCMCPWLGSQERSVSIVLKLMVSSEYVIKKRTNFLRKKLVGSDSQLRITDYCTIVFWGPAIWLEILENFCTKTFRFTWKKHGKNGPQVIRIVLCSNMDQSAKK